MPTKATKRRLLRQQTETYRAALRHRRNEAPPGGAKEPGADHAAAPPGRGVTRVPHTEGAEVTNTWVANLRAGCSSSTGNKSERRSFTLPDEALWQQALGRTLGPTLRYYPAAASLRDVPPGAAVGELSPISSDLTLNRSFIASKALKLLNTLLLR